MAPELDERVAHRAVERCRIDAHRDGSSANRRALQSPKLRSKCRDGFSDSDVVANRASSVLTNKPCVAF
jgi:hypothetical protein